jgi:hypothetical protein
VELTPCQARPQIRAFARATTLTPRLSAIPGRRPQPMRVGTHYARQHVHVAAAALGPDTPCRPPNPDACSGFTGNTMYPRGIKAGLNVVRCRGCERVDQYLVMLALA